MKQKISNQELMKVSRLQPLDRYRYFIKRVADFQLIYTLIDHESNYALAEIESNFLISFWSASEYASECATGEWSNYKIQELSLLEFESILIPEIKQRGLLLNIFSIPDKTGFVVDLDEFQRDLSLELRKYE